MSPELSQFNANLNLRKHIRHIVAPALALAVSIVPSASGSAEEETGIIIPSNGSHCVDSGLEPGSVAEISAIVPFQKHPSFAMVGNSEQISSWDRKSSLVNSEVNEADPITKLVQIGPDGKICGGVSDHGSIDRFVVDLHNVWAPGSPITEGMEAVIPRRLMDTQETGIIIPSNGSHCVDSGLEPGSVAEISAIVPFQKHPSFAMVGNSEQISSWDRKSSLVNSEVNEADPITKLVQIGPDGKICGGVSDHGSIDRFVVDLHNVWAPGSPITEGMEAVIPRRLMDTQETGIIIPSNGSHCVDSGLEPGSVAEISAIVPFQKHPSFAMVGNSEQISSWDRKSSLVNSEVNEADPITKLVQIGPDGKICGGVSDHGSIDRFVVDLHNVWAPGSPITEGMEAVIPRRLMDTSEEEEAGEYSIMISNDGSSYYVKPEQLVIECFFKDQLGTGWEGNGRYDSWADIYVSGLKSFTGYPYSFSRTNIVIDRKDENNNIIRRDTPTEPADESGVSRSMQSAIVQTNDLGIASEFIADMSIFHHATPEHPNNINGSQSNYIVRKTCEPYNP